MIEKTFLYKGITTLEIKILNALRDFGRNDVSLQQLYYELNHKLYYNRWSKPKLEELLDKLIEKGYVKRIEYKGGIYHYLLERNFTY